MSQITTYESSSSRNEVHIATEDGVARALETGQPTFAFCGKYWVPERMDPGAPTCAMCQQRKDQGWILTADGLIPPARR